MRLADDSLIAIMEALRRGLMEGADVSEDLRKLDFIDDGKGKLTLSKPAQDVWTTPET